MKYKCKYYSGGGSEYDGGVWERKETPKTIVLTCVDEPFFDLIWKKLVIAKDVQKNKHPMTEWSDGTFTVYPDQSGTPYVFEPVN